MHLKKTKQNSEKDKKSHIKLVSQVCTPWNLLVWIQHSVIQGGKCQHSASWLRDICQLCAAKVLQIQQIVRTSLSSGPLHVTSHSGLWLFTLVFLFMESILCGSFSDQWWKMSSRHLKLFCKKWNNWSCLWLQKKNPIKSWKWSGGKYLCCDSLWVYCSFSDSH